MGHATRRPSACRRSSPCFAGRRRRTLTPSPGTCGPERRPLSPALGVERARLAGVAFTLLLRTVFHCRVGARPLPPRRGASFGGSVKLPRAWSLFSFFRDHEERAK